MLSLRRITRFAPTLFKTKRNFTALSTLDPQLIYTTGLQLTGLLLFTTNVITGIKIVNRQKKLLLKNDNYTYCMVFGISYLKACFYSFLWPFFWPWALFKTLILPRRTVYVNLNVEYNWPHNFNGLVPHFIPAHRECLCGTHESIIKLAEENRVFDHLVIKLFRSSFKMCGVLKSIIGKFL